MKIRNKTDEPQAVTNVPEFAPGESREVDDDTGTLLLRSPFIFERVDSGSSMKAVEKPSAKNKTMRGVES